MCCHTRPANRRLMAALANHAQMVGSGHEMWVGESATRKEMDGLLSAVLDSRAFQNLGPVQRAEASAELLSAIDDLKGNYPNRTLVAAATRDLEGKAARRRASKKTRRVGAGVAIATLAATIGMGIGAAQPTADASAVSVLKADKSSSVVYSNPSKGKCDVGEKKVVVKKGQRVLWEWKNGNQSHKKKMKKTRKVCAAAEAAPKGSFAAPPMKDGVITGLPKDFPKNPTVGDIKNLGWGPETKVSPTVVVPQPKRPQQTGITTANSVRPGAVISATPLGNGDYEVTYEVIYDGGRGLVKNGYKGDDTFIELNPNGEARGVITQRLSEYGTPGGSSTHMGGTLEENWGQDHLPSSTTLYWSGVEKSRQPAANANGALSTGMAGSGVVDYDAETNSVIQTN